MLSYACNHAERKARKRRHVAGTLAILSALPAHNGLLRSVEQQRLVLPRSNIELKFSPRNVVELKLMLRKSGGEPSKQHKSVGKLRHRHKRRDREQKLQRRNVVARS